MKISKISILFLVLPAITLCADDPLVEQKLQVTEELPVVTNVTLQAPIEGHQNIPPSVPASSPESPTPVTPASQPSTHLDSSGNPSPPTQPPSIVPASSPESLTPVTPADQPSTDLDSSDNSSLPTQSPSIVPESSPESPTPVTPADQPSTDLDSSEDLSTPTQLDSHSYRSEIGLRFNELKGIGYKQGYTTVESFNLFGLSPSFMPWLDLRGHVFNNGKLAGNIGIGGRSLFSSINHMLGAFLYYDVRGAHRLTVNQLSPGLELLGKRMEYRLNGYFPVGKQHSSLYDRQFDTFKNHTIWLKMKQKQAMRGFDAEVGAHLAERSSYDIYLGAGPYYLNSSQASSWGGKLRLLGRYKDIFSLQATYSYDRLFGSIIQGEAAIRYTFGGKFKDKKLSKNEKAVLHRARFAPSRLEIPVITTVRRHEKAVNPATKQPWQAWFVNNTSHSLGTYESPFSTLVDAQMASGPNDIIYVFPGDGSTTGMNAGITLQNGQQLLGSGITQSISTTRGQIKIPAHSSGRPLITNLGGNVITLANQNQVSGVGLQVAVLNSTGIDGTSGIQDTLIQNNTITGSVIHAGMFIEGSGTFTVINNQLTGPIATNDLYHGIRLRAVDGTSSVIGISYNQVNGYNKGISIGPFLNPNNVIANAVVQGNNISNFHTNGIYYPTGMRLSTVRITENTILNNAGIGDASPVGDSGGISVSVNLSPDSGNVVIDNNQITTTSTNVNTRGLHVAINIGTGANLAAQIENNSITNGSGAGSLGVHVYTLTAGQICTSIINNTVTQTATGTNDFTIETAGTGVI
ncbi:MAG TPA: inverse autotransporter beta domain-containing protein, partial [Rhabdochlamydiaceae bacterium]|nr:inverse autotransporter beta domain-containing protein [Rhabdochlamydiaceae bacterium]